MGKNKVVIAAGILSLVALLLRSSNLIIDTGTDGVPLALGRIGAFLCNLTSVSLLLSTGFVTIKPGTRGVLFTLGRVVAILGEGLHYHLPFISKVVIVNIKTQRYKAKTTAASRDLQIVSSEIVLNYRVALEKVDEIIREIGPNYEQLIVEPAVQEALKASAAQFTAEELITRHPDVSNAIRTSLEARLSKRGFVIEDVSIKTSGRARRITSSERATLRLKSPEPKQKPRLA